MSKKDEALKLALDALNTTESDCGSRAWEREQEAITAIREALAEQPAKQQETDDSLLLCASDLEHSAIYDNHAEMQSCIRAVASRIKTLATPQPASKPWVGLTESERADLRYEADIGPDAIIKATEAKLREKNA